MERITVSLPASFDVAYPAAAGGDTFKVATGDIPQHILDTMLAFCIKQKLDHKVAGFIKKGKTEAEGREACDELMEQLLGGTWAARGGARIVTFEDFCLSQANKEVKAWAKKNPEKAKDRNLGEIAAKVAKDEARRKGWETAWAAIQAAKRSTADTSIDDLVGEI